MIDLSIDPFDNVQLCKDLAHITFDEESSEKGIDWFILIYISASANVGYWEEPQRTESA